MDEAQMKTYDFDEVEQIYLENVRQAEWDRQIEEEILDGEIALENLAFTYQCDEWAEEHLKFEKMAGIRDIYLW